MRAFTLAQTANFLSQKNLHFQVHAEYKYTLNFHSWFFIHKRKIPRASKYYLWGSTCFEQLSVYNKQEWTISQFWIFHSIFSQFSQREQFSVFLSLWHRNVYMFIGWTYEMSSTSKHILDTVKSYEQIGLYSKKFFSQISYQLYSVWNASR